jgi:hypothetical protein
MCFFAWRHANGGGATKGRRVVGGAIGRAHYDRWGLPPSSRSLAHMSRVGVDGYICLSHGYVSMTRQWSMWCFIWSFDVEPTWDQRWRSLGGPLPWISDVAGVGGAPGGTLWDWPAWPSGPKVPIASTCLLCPFSSPFCTNFAIIPAYK